VPALVLSYICSTGSIRSDQEELILNPGGADNDTRFTDEEVLFTLDEGPEYDAIDFEMSDTREVADKPVPGNKSTADMDALESIHVSR